MSKSKLLLALGGLLLLGVIAILWLRSRGANLGYIGMKTPSSEEATGSSQAPAVDPQPPAPIEEQNRPPQWRPGPPPTVPGFTYLRTEAFSVGGPEYLVPIYRCERFAQALGLASKESAPDCEFALVPGGSFVMGSPHSEEDRFPEAEDPRHSVVLPAYLLARTEVSQRVWTALTADGKNPSHNTTAGDLAPVEKISWYDAVAWCKEVGVRLPSESEWERAARGGTVTAYFIGEDADKLHLYAWFDRDLPPYMRPRGAPEPKEQTHPVGEKLPNQFGLLDTGGNVWEWCQDLWHDSYKDAPADGSVWTKGVSTRRVARGGSYLNFNSAARSAMRNGFEADDRASGTGFRPAASLP